MSKHKEFQINCLEWGCVRFIRTIPRGGDPWGSFRCFVGTPFEDYFTVVDSEMLGNAIRGHHMPLINALKPNSELISKKIPDDFLCDSYKNRSCPIRDKKKCKPGPKTPLCYVLSGFDPESLDVVVSSVRDGAHLLVVTGE